MSIKQEKLTKLTKQTPNDPRVVADEQPQQDTATGFDTAVFIEPINPESTVTTVPTPHQRSSTTKAKVTSRKKRRRTLATKTSSPYLVVTGQAEDEETSSENSWDGTYRGMPSWLTSMLIHLSLILMLALLSVNSGGRQTVELFGETSDSTEIEPYTTFDLALKPEEIQTVAEEFDSLDSELNESSEMAPVLDEALMSASLESALEQNLFEKISSSGVDESDLPRLNNAGNAEFFGIEGNGSDFVFIIDCSDSMNDYGRWNQAVDELKRSINRLTAEQRFLILLYNSGYVAMNNKAKLVRSTKVAQEKAIRWLSSKTPNNWTFCAAALADALKLRPSAVFLLSDGEFSDRKEVFGVLNRLNSKKAVKYAKSQQIPVHTVALGSHIGRFTMERIARENNGEFKLIE